MEQNSTAQNANGKREILTFEVQNQTFGILMNSINEIVRSNENRITLFPGAPPALKGLLNLRGRIVTVFSLCVLTNAANNSYINTSEGILLLYKKKSELIGFWANALSSVINEAEGIFAPSEEAFADISSASFIREEYPNLILLDIKKLIDKALKTT